MPNSKVSSIAIISIIVFISAIAAIIFYNVHINNELKKSIEELSQLSANDFTIVQSKGNFPAEMQGFLSNSKEDLSKFSFSNPNDLRNKSIMCSHYEGVLLYKGIDLKKYKQELIPRLKKLIGKYSSPQQANSDSQMSAPDLKKYQNTLIEWCLIANCFEEKDDGNSAFILSYGAIRMAMCLLNDYSDGANYTNIEIANNILRCACCQLIYIANSGLKHNANMVRAIAKDLYNMSYGYPPFSKIIDYDIKQLNNMLQETAKLGNYAATYYSTPKSLSQFSKELKKSYSSLLEYCDKPYFESYKKISSWYQNIRTKIDESITNIDTSDLNKSIAFALLNNSLPDYEKEKFNIDETRVIIDGTATVLATYEYIARKKGNFTYSGTLISSSVDSSYPVDMLSGRAIQILLPGVFMVNNGDASIFSDSVDSNSNDDLIFLSKSELQLKLDKEEYKSTYFDADEAQKDITPEQNAALEKMIEEIAGKSSEIQQSANELIIKTKTPSKKVESIDSFNCGFTFGQVAKDVDESCYSKSAYLGPSFRVESKKPFLNEFYYADVIVDEAKKVLMISYSKSFDTTSEREVPFWHIQNTIEDIDGIKLTKNTEDNDTDSLEYINEKNNYKIKLSLLKGLDGGGTLSLSVTSNKN